MVEVSEEFVAAATDLQRQLSEAVERAEMAEGWAKAWHGIVETICTVLELGTPDADQVVAAVRAKFEQAERAWEREAKLATHMANDRNDAEAEVARLREALTTVRGHFHVEHGAGRIPSIGYDSQALLKVIHTLDAALQGEPSPKPQPSMSWPNGCYSPNSCTRHKVCMYYGCRHEGEDIKPEIETALRAALQGEPKP